MHLLRVKATYLLDVLGIGEDFAVDVLELVGARTEHLHNYIRSLPWWGELVAVLVALYEVEDQVPDVEGSAPHSSAVVSSQCLLVLCRVEEGDVACFIQLVHGILMACLGSLFVVRPNP